MFYLSYFLVKSVFDDDSFQNMFVYKENAIHQS